MEVFLVVQEGVYRHLIHGVFTSEQAAVDAAVDECRKQKDDYHNYGVYKTTLGKLVEDVEEVCTVSRNTPHNSGGCKSIDPVKWLRARYVSGGYVEFNY